MAEDNQVPAKAIQMLRDNPDLSGDFEEKYGVPASAYLAETDPSATANEVVAAENAPAETEGSDEGGILSAIGDVISDVAVGVTEVPGAVARGAASGFEEIGDLATEGINAVGDFVDTEIPTNVRIDTETPGVPLISLITTKESDELLRSNPEAVSFFGDSEVSDAAEATGFDERETVTGQLTEGIAQFMTAYVTGSKVASSAGWAAKSGYQFLRPLVIGAAADFAAFDEHEARLSDLLSDALGEDSPALFEYLRADETDSFMEGRLKNAVEGGVLGLAVEPFMRLLASWRKVKVAQAAGDTAAAEAGIKEMDATLTKQGQAVVDDLPIEKQLEMFDDLPRQDTPAGIQRRAEEALTNETGLPGGRPLDQGQTTRLEENLDAADALDSPIAQALGWGGRELSDFQKRLDRVFSEEISFNEAFEDIPLNLKHFTSDETAKAMAALTDAISARMPAEWNSIQKWDAAARASQGMLGADPGQIIRGLSATSEESVSWPARFLSYKITESSLARTLFDLHRSGAPKEQVNQVAALFSHVTTDLKNLSSNVARTLNIHQMDVGESAQQVNRLKQALDEAAGDPKLVSDVLARLSRKPGWLRQAYAAVAKAKTWDVVNEVWINSILSGPRTHLINLTGNLMQATLMPIEQAMGGLVRGDLRAVQASGVQVAQQWMALGDAFKMARAAWNMGENVLDPFHRVIDTERTTKAIGGNAPLDLLGNIIRIPSRALGAGDEFFKQINYRSKVYADAWMEAQTKRLSPTEQAAFIANRVDNAFDETGRAVSNTPWGKRALEYAQEATFTNDLGPLGQAIQRTVAEHPWMRQIAPFIRTPTNLLMQAGQRVPGFRLFSQKWYAELRSPDPTIRSRAIGKQMTGALVGATVLQLAAEGRISGSGPKDHTMRSNLMQTGWQPYSIRFGDTWYEYKRLEPVATIMGVLADLSEVSAELSGRQYDEVAGMTIMGIMKEMYEASDNGLLAQAAYSTVNTISEKSYLQGIFDVLDAINADSPDKFARFFQNRAGSAVPFSQFQRQLNPDSGLHEVRTTLDAVRQTVWWLGDETAEATGVMSGRLADRYDVLGQRMVRTSNPWFIPLVGPSKRSEQNDDPLWREINSFAASPKSSTAGAVRPPPESKGNVVLPEFKNRNGIDAYERYSQLIGSIQHNGKTMEEALRELIASDAYQNPQLGNNFRNSDGVSYEGIKASLFSGIVRGYREIAWAKLSQEAFRNESGLTLGEAWLNDMRNAAMNKGNQLDLDKYPVR